MRRQLVLFLCTLQFSIPPTLSAQDVDSKSENEKPVSISQARELLLTGSYREAATAFGNLAAEPKTKIVATLGLAETKMRVGDYQDAIALLEPLDAPKS